MNIRSKSLSVELIFLSVETESVHLRVRVPVPDYRRPHFTAENDAGGHVHAHANAHGTHTFSRRANFNESSKYQLYISTFPYFHAIGTRAFFRT